MADEFKHTTAAEMEDFLSKSDSEQKLMMWLDGRETNGQIVEAFNRIASLGLELQKARHDLSQHLEKVPHPNRMEYEQMVIQHRDLWSVWRFSRWFIPISIPASIMIVTTIFEIVRIARGG